MSLGLYSLGYEGDQQEKLFRHSGAFPSIGVSMETWWTERKVLKFPSDE